MANENQVESERLLETHFEFFLHEITCKNLLENARESNILQPELTLSTIRISFPLERLNSEQKDKLVSTLASTEYIDHIELRNTHDDEVTAPRLVALFDVLIKSKTIKHLSLVGCTAVSGALPELKKLLEVKGYLKVLSLRACGLTCKAISEIAELLKDNCSLEWLYLHRNLIKDEGVKDLVSTLFYNTTLKYLGLDSNPISKEGIDSLCLLIINHPSLEQLSLQDCAWNITNDGNQLLAGAVLNIRLRHNGNGTFILNLLCNKLNQQNKTYYFSSAKSFILKSYVEWISTQAEEEGPSYIIDLPGWKDQELYATREIIKSCLIADDSALNSEADWSIKVCLNDSLDVFLKLYDYYHQLSENMQYQPQANRNIPVSRKRPRSEDEKEAKSESRIIVREDSDAIFSRNKYQLGNQLLNFGKNILRVWKDAPSGKLFKNYKEGVHDKISSKVDELSEDLNQSQPLTLTQEAHNKDWSTDDTVADSANVNANGREPKRPCLSTSTSVILFSPTPERANVNNTPADSSFQSTMNYST